ncbi:hypothetical protein [Phenylobacterium sp.]|jgi:hypothetical protein|uniref:hypothetical protein n=1 Tax=Phenylobacterium sp. TaxID=1871053 RepID=UPI002F40E20B
MSCDAAAAAVYLWLAAASPMAATPVTSPQVAAPSGAVAYEPLFADIVQRARRLKSEVEGFRAAHGAVPEAFRTEVRALSDLDMKGHVTLAARGTDGDLKCILKGISQDLPLKLEALDAAKSPKDRDMALADLAYLLNDNVEVITAPPKPPV